MILRSFAAVLLLSGAVLPAFSQGEQVVREFRPLDAGKIEIRPASHVLAENRKSEAAAPFLQAAWSQFDSKNWGEAMTSFVAALKADSECREAAEGLAMSIYHSGDYDSAYRLGEELKVVMPNVRRVVAETALSDARSFVAQGKFAEARAFLAHFPATGPTLAYAHQMVQSADTLTAAVNSNETEPIGGPLVRN